MVQCVAVCCPIVSSPLGCANGSIEPLLCTQFVAVCCSVLQRVAACCSVLQRVTTCCSVLQCVAVWCSVSDLLRAALWAAQTARSSPCGAWRRQRIPARGSTRRSCSRASPYWNCRWSAPTWLHKQTNIIWVSQIALNTLAPARSRIDEAHLRDYTLTNTHAYTYMYKHTQV